jgi:hypothetical protein
VLGTAGTYVAGDIEADTQSCSVRRELILMNGSPDLQAGRSALLKTPEARTYLALAIGTLNLEQRREYAFLGVTAANTAIMATPSKGKGGGEVELIAFPTDKQLLSLPYMAGLAQRVNRLDIDQLVQTLKVHDQNFAEKLSDLRECDHLADVGAIIGVMALLFTLLSVAMIAFREYHQGRRTPRRQRRASGGT